jgi:prepilin-type N-terminal cleavage/methylation domain-containing protein
MWTQSSHGNGFTLIELSIVLVIIGLIVGGVLVGQNLIDAAAVRAQISQIEKYNTAANTFRGKYGYLPGDIPNPYAAQFGFLPRGTYKGQGDGNGVIQSITMSGGFNCHTRRICHQYHHWHDDRPVFSAGKNKQRWSCVCC